MKPINTDAPVITIDGPSGAGKGTVSLKVAEKLGWVLLDSGAIYRVMAVAQLKKGIELTNISALSVLAESLNVRFQQQQIFLDDEDITAAVRTEECGNNASKVAAIPEVRTALLQRQRLFQQTPGLVADGRDMGTTVFPTAGTKVFLTASQQERAKRRYKQLKENGIDVNMPQVLKQVAERDERDTQRSASPLAPADDAMTVDSTALSIDEVVDVILSKVV
jgi:CMP/dCMP kinase